MDSRGEELTFTVGDYDGEFKHLQTLDELAKHKHPLHENSGDGDLDRSGTDTIGFSGDKNVGTIAGYTDEVGLSQPMNVMQPYYVVSV